MSRSEKLDELEQNIRQLEELIEKDEKKVHASQQEIQTELIQTKMLLKSLIIFAFDEPVFDEQRDQWIQIDELYKELKSQLVQGDTDVSDSLPEMFTITTQQLRALRKQ